MKKEFSFFFSIIIPVKAINNDLIKNIKSINRLQKNLNFNIETIVVTNNHCLQGKNYKNIKFISSGKVGPGIKRDQAAKIAKGKYLIFFDDDSYPSYDYFKLAKKILNQLSINIIGGPGIIPYSSSNFQKIVGEFYESKLAGGVPERYKSVGIKKRLTDDWPSVNFIIKKETFHKIKGFELDYWPGEDTFLCQKLINKNFEIFYIPQLVVWHKKRTNFTSFLKQIKNYAFHRGFFAKKFGGNSKKFFYLVPSVFLIFIILSATNYIFNFSNKFEIITSAGLILYILYLTLIFICTLKKKIVIALGLVALVPISHLIYGLSFIMGLLKNKINSKLR